MSHENIKGKDILDKSKIKCKVPEADFCLVG